MKASKRGIENLKASKMGIEHLKAENKRKRENEQKIRKGEKMNMK